MPDSDLLTALMKIGVDTRTVVDSWKDTVELLAAIDAIGRTGSNALVKIDGERSGPEVYTVVISGGRLGDASFRRDGSDLQSLLRDAILFFAEHVTTSAEQ